MYSEPRQRSKTEVFTKISNDFKPLTIFATYSILDAWLDFEYAPEIKWLVSIWNATPGWNGLSKVNSKLTQVPEKHPEQLLLFLFVPFEQVSIFEHLRRLNVIGASCLNSHNGTESVRTGWYDWLSCYLIQWTNKYSISKVGLVFFLQKLRSTFSNTFLNIKTND